MLVLDAAGKPLAVLHKHCPVHGIKYGEEFEMVPVVKRDWFGLEDFAKVAQLGKPRRLLSRRIEGGEKVLIEWTEYVAGSVIKPSTPDAQSPLTQDVS